MTASAVLEGIVVTELGGREGVAVCGLLLAQLGATVIVVEPPHVTRPRDACRAQFVAGKLSLASDGVADRGLIDRLIAGSHVVLTSSDIDPASLQVTTTDPGNIVCDLTAFGSSGPWAGLGYTEGQMQALTAIMDTTGPADGAPLPLGVPIIGYASGVSAAAAVLCALRVKRLLGFGQRIEVAMFDTAFVSLHTYLAGVQSGSLGARTRMGNRHPTTAAWNLFHTSDGQVLICAGSQSQWQRLCDLMQRPDVAAKFSSASLRMQGLQEVEAAIEAWTVTLTTAECVAQLVAAGVAAGPIAAIDGHPVEANLDYRGMLCKLLDPADSSEVFVPASPLALRGSPPLPAQIIAARGADRAAIARIAERLAPSSAVHPIKPGQRPLTGVRVIEIGQYTTAPLCARHLAHLGAEVIKIEKPGGDESRTFAPREGQRSEVYCLANADKRSIVLDLQTPAGMDVLKALLHDADVLVENTKPGTLARYGLSSADLAALYPQLVTCAISGFGVTSMYGDRPGFDTVIQAMSGFMSAVNPGGTPLKSGISSADVMGSQMGLVAILAALEFRDQGQGGQFIDLSMQDIACWVTAPVWNVDLGAIEQPQVLACTDGYVYAGASATQLSERLQRAGVQRESLANLSRAAADRQLRALGLQSAPVLSVVEVCALPQTAARGIWFSMPAEGRDWPMHGTTIRLMRTPPKILRQAPALDEDGPAILQALRMAQPNKAP